jgi:hypothetical protein
LLYPFLQPVLASTAVRAMTSGKINLFNFICFVSVKIGLRVCEIL